MNKTVGGTVSIEMVERFDFYERAKKAFVVVRTGETAPYGNIILRKGMWLGGSDPEGKRSTHIPAETIAALIEAPGMTPQMIAAVINANK